MDYNKVLEYHISKKADVTVVCKDMPANVNVERFYIIKMNEESRIEEFEEKPIEARPIPFPVVFMLSADVS